MGEIDQVGSPGEVTAGAIEEECARLSQIGALLTDALERSTPSAWHPRLERALRELIDHERSLDAAGGPHSRLMAEHPELYGKVRLLQTEHGALTRTVRRLAEACRSADDPEEAERLCRQLRHLAGRIEQHRRATLEVLEEARAR